jgi:hypothetical protein
MPDNPLLRVTERDYDDALNIPAGVSVHEVRIVSALLGASAMTQGQDVAGMSVRSDGHTVVERTLRAGVDTMDWAWENGGAQHARVEIAGDALEQQANGATAHRVLSFARITFDRPVAGTSIAFRNLMPRGELVVYGVTLVDDSGSLHHMFGRTALTKYHEVFKSDGIAVLENSDALPRAFMVYQWQHASVGASLEAMERRSFAPRDEVVIASDTPLTASSELPAFRALTSAPRQPSATVSMVAYTPVEVRVHVGTAEDGLLVLTDAYYPGWRAYVDGSEQPILRGDMLFRTVEVPAGEHDVVIRFEPSTVQLGGALSAAAVLGGFVLLVIGRRLAPRRSKVGIGLHEERDAIPSHGGQQRANR